MRVTVTQEHIDRGTRSNCSGCPLALVLGEVFGQVVVVGPNPADWFGGGWSVWLDGVRSYRLPGQAREWAKRYDAGEEVGPITFEIPEVTG